MIDAKDAIATARALIGTPYAELDCINLIKKVIRTAPGGVPGYTTAGTNTLWNSRNASAKYRDLTYTQEGVSGARAGMLVFKSKGENVHHVGLVTGDGTVIHSSSAKGCVVETGLDSSWQLLAMHRYIEAAEEETQMSNPMDGYADPVTLYRARVSTQRDPLTLRSAPEGDRIGRLPRGAVVDVIASSGAWAQVRCGSMSGYCAEAYLTRIEEDAASPDDSGEPVTTLRREDGTTIQLVGRWEIAAD